MDENYFLRVRRCKTWVQFEVWYKSRMTFSHEYKFLLLRYYLHAYKDTFSPLWNICQDFYTYKLVWFLSDSKRGSLTTDRIDSRQSKSHSSKIFQIIKNFWICLGNFRGFAIFDIFFHQLLFFVFIWLSKWKQYYEF